MKCPKAKANQFIKTYRIRTDPVFMEYDEEYVRNEVECQYIASQLNLSPKIYEYGKCGVELEDDSTVYKIRDRGGLNEIDQDKLSYYIITELIPSRDLEQEIKIVYTSQKVQCTLSMYETLVHKYIIPVLPLLKTLYYETLINYSDHGLRNILYTGHRFYLIDFGESYLFSEDRIEYNTISAEIRVSNHIEILLLELRNRFSMRSLMSELDYVSITLYIENFVRNIPSLLQQI